MISYSQDSPHTVVCKKDDPIFSGVPSPSPTRARAFSRKIDYFAKKIKKKQYLIYKTFSSLKNLLSTKNESDRFSQPTSIQCLLVLFWGLTLRRK